MFLTCITESDLYHISINILSGADEGLQLHLNMETYEYMPGPHDAAGLKFLVHDPDELPLVEDLGQAIPVGSHTFVGMKIIRVCNYH